MSFLAGVFGSLAVLAVTGAGLSTIVGLHSLRERFFGFAVVLTIASLATRAIGTLLTGFLEASPTVDLGVPKPHGFAIAIPLVVIGHMALVVFLIRRKRRQSRGQQANGNDLTHARGRRRTRLTPDGEEP